MSCQAKVPPQRAVASGDFTLVSDGGKSFPAAGNRLPTGDYMVGGLSGLAAKWTRRREGARPSS